MSKKRDPIVDVLRYFSDADILLAQQALMLAKEIIRNRQPLRKTPAAAAARPRAAQPMKKPAEAAS